MRSATTQVKPRGSGTQARVTVALVLFGIVVAFVLITVSLERYKEQLKEDAYNHLSSMASVQQQRVSTFINNLHESAGLIVSRTQLRLSLDMHNRQPNTIHTDKIQKIIEDALRSQGPIKEISIADINGVIVASTLSEEIGKSINVEDHGLGIERGRDQSLEIHTHKSLVLEEELIGSVRITIHATGLEEIVSNYVGLGDSGESILAEQLDNGDARFLTALRFDPEASLNRTIPAHRTDIPIIRALSGVTGFHDDIVDYREIPVVAVTTYVPETGWGMLIKMDQSEVFESYHKLVYELLKLLLLVALAGTVIAYFMAKYITRPLVHLREISEKIRRGDSTARADLSSVRYDREAFQLAQSFNAMTDEILQVFEAAPSGMLEADTDDVITRVNHSLELMFGYEKGELVGKPVEKLMPKKYRTLHRKRRNQYESSEDPQRLGGELELYGLKKNGELIPVEVGLSKIEGAAGSRMLATIVDISDRIRRLREEEIQREKDNFFASMSHELRTPLTAIIGNSDYLLDEEMDEKHRRILQTINAAGQNQLALVNDILDMSKIESGKFTISEAPYSLKIMLDQLQQMLSIKAQDEGILLEFNQENREPYQLMGDRQRIQQVLINLIGNALKFTDEGKVTVTTRQVGDSLLFTVEDTGIGMSPEMMEKLFSRFEQADGSICRRFGGSGLGLFISLNLAELMGGTIDASSQEGVGSIFQLNLPYRRSEIREEYTENQSRQSAAIAEKLIGHILLAEDTPLIQQLVKRMLEKMGLQISTAVNGLEAVELATAQPFDLILMDMQMPEMDGIEATQVLRERGITTPIFALTANVMDKHRRQFTEAGCDAFIGKPIDKDDLQRKLAEYLESE